MRQLNKILIINFLSLMSFYCYSQKVVKNDIIFDWVNGDNSSNFSIDSNAHLFSPSNEDVLLSKELSIQYIDSLNTVNHIKILKYGNTKYYRQYLGYIDKNGDKIIYINGFCSYNGNQDLLTKKWIWVLDGGSCYYQIKVNLTKKICFDLSTNGEA